MISSTQPLLYNSIDSSENGDNISSQRRRRQLCLADVTRRRTTDGPITAATKLLDEELGNQEVATNKIKNGSDSNLHQLQVMKYPSFRKLSESRGINLPVIEMKRTQSAQPGVESVFVTEEYSPVTQVIKFPESVSHDRSSNSQSFIQKTSDDASDLELLDIRIFFSDGKCVQFTVEGGMRAQSSDLLHLLAEHLEISEDAINSCFALWLTSPLLEVQLKPHHVAAEVRQKWPSFLKKYTLADDDAIAWDEPLLVLRRNVSLTVESEREWEKDYEKIVDILYLDAKDEYLTGRYLVDVDFTLDLAALQILIEYGPYEEEGEAIDLVHDRLSEFVPAQHLSHVRSFKLFGLPIMECKHGLEKEVVQAYSQFSKQYQDQCSRKKAYLDILRSTPFYGAAFFFGKTERRSTTLPILDFGKRFLTGSTPSAKMPVRIGIQSKYITVVDPSKNEILLTQKIEDCSWLKSEIADIPEFFLHFPDPEYATRPSSPHHLENGDIIEAPASKLLQIFSKQAYMMIALLDSLDHIAVSELGSAHDLHHVTILSSSSAEHEAAVTSSDENDSQCSPSVKDSSTSKASSSVPSSLAARQHHQLQRQQQQQSQHIATHSIGKLTLKSGFDSTSYGSNKLSKLCLATLDPKGCCVEAQGSLKKLFVTVH